MNENYLNIDKSDSKYNLRWTTWTFSFSNMPLNIYINEENIQNKVNKQSK